MCLALPFSHVQRLVYMIFGKKRGIKYCSKNYVILSGTKNTDQFSFPLSTAYCFLYVNCAWKNVSRIFH